MGRTYQALEFKVTVLWIPAKAVRRDTNSKQQGPQ